LIKSRVNDPATLNRYDKPTQSGLLQLDWFGTYSVDGVWSEATQAMTTAFALITRFGGPRP